MKIAILDDWFDTLRTLPCFAKLEGHDVTVHTDHTEDVDILAKRLADTEALVLFRERTPVTAALVERLPRLRLISQRGVHPHIDLEACTRNGILLCSKKGPGAPNVAAAEHTFALILNALREIPAEIAALKAGTWQTGVGRTAHGKRLGIYGYGKIGQIVAGYARAFGMEVVVWGREGSLDAARADGTEIAESREAFFAEADIVSLHIRLTPETRGLVTEADLAAMKPDAILVNTSRSGLIAPGNLLAALERGRPGMAAIDVFDAEPTTTDPLIHHPRVIATPHIGYVTREELDLQFGDIFDQITAYAADEPIHMVNPEVLDRT